MSLSSNFTHPGFSMAPTSYSGQNTWSYFPNGYGTSKMRW